MPQVWSDPIVTKPSVGYTRLSHEVNFAAEQEFECRLNSHTEQLSTPGSILTAFKADACGGIARGGQNIRYLQPHNVPLKQELLLPSEPYRVARVVWRCLFRFTLADQYGSGGEREGP